MYYEEHGSGSPLLLIMGLAVDSQGWMLQTPEFAKHYRTVVFDNRGVGRSAKPAGPYTTAQMAADAVGLLDALDIEEAHVVGISMGGMIAQELALGFQDRLQSLTLVATHGGARVASLPTPKGMWLFLKGLFGGRKARLKSLPRLLYTDEFIASMGSELREHLDIRLGRPPKLRTVLGQLYAVNRHSTESRLHQIQTPTLLVRPGRDILIRPTQTDRLAARIPNAEVLRFDDAGHGVTFQKAAELNAALRVHFARHESTPKVERTDDVARTLR